MVCAVRAVRAYCNLRLSQFKVTNDDPRTTHKNRRVIKRVKLKGRKSIPNAFLVLATIIMDKSKNYN